MFCCWFCVVLLLWLECLISVVLRCGIVCVFLLFSGVGLEVSPGVSCSLNRIRFGSGSGMVPSLGRRSEIWPDEFVLGAEMGAADGLRAAANTVKLTLAGTPFLRSCLWEIFSQDSHSSTWTSSVLLRIHIRRRSGASPGIKGRQGPTCLSVPRHNTRWRISCAGCICCIMFTMSPESTTWVPTRGAVWSASFITVCQVGWMENRSEICCGLILSVSRLRLVGCSTSFASATWLNGPSLRITLATWRANFRG